MYLLRANQNKTMRNSAMVHLSIVSSVWWKSDFTLYIIYWVIRHCILLKNSLNCLLICKDKEIEIEIEMIEVIEIELFAVKQFLNSRKSVAEIFSTMDTDSDFPKAPTQPWFTPVALELPKVSWYEQQFSDHYSFIPPLDLHV